MKDIIESFQLGPQWPTFDPFLFCAHHLDSYPPGNADLGPQASLHGRQLGSDFDNLDGWRMYHGLTVPGFPQHPHRGFETVTYVRQGLIDHTDSIGSSARFGRGDSQWLTAGSGIVHAEMFPLTEPDRANPLELFQIWLNLPASNKMVDPYFTMLWGGDTPEYRHHDEADKSTMVTVIAGQLGSALAPSPPPDSWAATASADVAIWHLVFDPQAEWTLPPASHNTTLRTIYVFNGSSLAIGDESLAPGNGAVIRSDVPVKVVGGADGSEAMVLQGVPIGEPIASHGPFVMNTKAELQQAFSDYQASGFGGWPWATNDPTHGQSDRFAKYADGRTETPNLGGVTYNQCG